MERVKTGFECVDDILGGGILPGQVVGVSSPGFMGNDFCMSILEAMAGAGHPALCICHYDSDTIKSEMRARAFWKMTGGVRDPRPFDSLMLSGWNIRNNPETKAEILRMWNMGPDLSSSDFLGGKGKASAQIRQEVDAYIREQTHGLISFCALREHYPFKESEADRTKMELELHSLEPKDGRAPVAFFSSVSTLQALENVNILRDFAIKRNAIAFVLYGSADIHGETDEAVEMEERHARLVHKVESMVDLAIALEMPDWEWEPRLFYVNVGLDLKAGDGTPFDCTFAGVRYDRIHSRFFE